MLENFSTYFNSFNVNFNFYILGFVFSSFAEQQQVSNVTFLLISFAPTFLPPLFCWISQILHFYISETEVINFPTESGHPTHDSESEMRCKLNFCKMHGVAPDAHCATHVTPGKDQPLINYGSALKVENDFCLFLRKLKLMI